MQLFLCLACLRLTLAQPSLLDFEEVVRQNPYNAAAHNNLGLALKNAGRPAEAIKRFETALLIDPAYGRAYNGLGSTKQLLGDASEAAKGFTTAISLLPTLGGAYTNLGNALRLLGNPDAAVTVLKHGLQLNTQNPAAYTNLGAALHAAGDSKGAIAFLTVATNMAANDVNALTNLGAALEAIGRLSEAEAAYERGLVLQPDSVEVRHSPAACGHLAAWVWPVASPRWHPHQLRAAAHGRALAWWQLHINRGNVLKGAGRLKEAITAYTTALQLRGADGVTG